MVSPIPKSIILILMAMAFLMPLSVHAQTVEDITGFPRFFHEDIASWQPHKDDVFIVDTQTNMGYLMHRNGDFLEFVIATGQRRTVRYLGMTYNAATPNTNWTVLSKDIQGDRITFDRDGVFFRLYKDADQQRSRYGIHSHLYIDNMLTRTNRYASMGCILVGRDIIKIVDETFRLDGSLPLVTVDGVESRYPLFADYLSAHKTIGFIGPVMSKN